MKVAIIGKFSIDLNQSYDGPSRVISNLVRALKTREELKIEIPIIKGKSFFNHIKNILKLNCDIYNIHGIGHIYFLTALIAKIKNKKIIYTCHGLVDDEYILGYHHPNIFSFYQKWILYNSDIIITATENLKQKLIIKYNLDYGKIIVVPMAIEPLFFKKDSIKLLKISNREFKTIFLFAGGSRQSKGLNFLLDTLSGFTANYKLIIVGNVSNSYIDQINKKYPSSLLKRLEILGEVNSEKLRELYDSCDALVHPSIYETFGLIPLEAMACGKTIIVTDQVGMSYLINHGLNGFKIQYGDKKGLKKLLELILYKPEILPRIGKNAAKSVSDLNWEEVSSKYFYIFNSVIPYQSVTGGLLP